MKFIKCDAFDLSDIIYPETSFVISSCLIYFSYHTVAIQSSSSSTEAAA